MPGPRIYDSTHKRLRKQWAPIVASGIVRCSRCNVPITPGTPWDLDHIHGGQHPAHRSCNRAAGAINKNTIYRKHKATRDW